jgi:hypothetical protein
MRDWWVRTLLVLQRPKPVFVALRNDTKDDLADRAEPVLALVLLAGIAFVLSTRTAGTLLDDADYDGVLVAIWAFIAGGLYSVFGYFVFGGVLDRVVKALGSQGTYRRSRHVLAFSAAPIALSLVLWPVKLALYGGDVFRAGGSDRGAGAVVFDVLEAAFLVWALALLVIGVRAVHGWTWARAVGACLAAVAVVAAISATAALL